MVHCEHRIRLDAYHDGELPAGERSTVEAHLRDCSSCAAELAAIRRVSRAFAATAPREPSDEQLLEMSQSVRAEPYDARMLLPLFRMTAIAAAVLLTGTVAWAVYLSQQTRAAAHEAMVLDHVAMWSQPVAVAADPVGGELQSEQQVAMARWIADDLRGRQEER